MEQIKVKVDYDVLVSKMLDVWNNVGNYEVILDEPSKPGRTKFKVNYIDLGELGTYEVKKDVDHCVVTFSNVTLVDDFEGWLKQAEQEARKMGEAPDGEIPFLARMMRQKMQIDPEFQKAKTQKWEEIIDAHKTMINKINKPGLQPQGASEPKHEGRYRLTDEELGYRKRIVRISYKKKKEYPLKRWKEICMEIEAEEGIDLPVRTLNSWRHDTKI